MRLIDADELKEVLHETIADEDRAKYWYDLIGVDEAINDAPTIDAVQVVRCKECVYRPCKQMPYSYDHDYCSYGERKDND